VRAAIGRAHEHVVRDDGFEDLHPGDYWWAGWLMLFHNLVKLVARSEAGEPAEGFNPHLRLGPQGRKVGQHPLATVVQDIATLGMSRA